jgi:hypothetical protein
MTTYSALQIGEYHLNHCEDYLFNYEIGKDKTICAVMDGCTMATDSYFASTLVGKLLRKVCKAKSYIELYQPAELAGVESYLKSIVKELFSELVIAKNQLMLERNELLTTLLLMVFDKRINEGVVLVIGDGLVSINGTVTEFDQDNKPDYIGYHLSEDFDKWYSLQKQKIYFDKLKDITIATDGIITFKQVAVKKTEDYIDPIHFLTIDTAHAGNDEMLNLKLKILENIYGLKPTDDLGLIRVIA